MFKIFLKRHQLTFVADVSFFPFAGSSSGCSELDRSNEIGFNLTSSTTTTGSPESGVSLRGRGFDSRHFNLHRHTSPSSRQFSELSQKLSSGHFVSSQNDRQSASVNVASANVASANVASANVASANVVSVNIASRDTVTLSTLFCVVVCRQPRTVIPQMDTKYTIKTTIVFIFGSNQNSLTLIHCHIFLLSIQN